MKTDRLTPIAAPESWLSNLGPGIVLVDGNKAVLDVPHPNEVLKKLCTLQERDDYKIFFTLAKDGKTLLVSFFESDDYTKALAYVYANNQWPAYVISNALGAMEEWNCSLNAASDIADDILRALDDFQREYGITLEGADEETIFWDILQYTGF